MGLNVFIVQYPAKVKVSTISRPSASPEQESKTGWPGLLYERLDQLRSEAVGAGKDDDESRSINAGNAEGDGDGEEGRSDKFDVVVEAPDEVPDIEGQQSEGGEDLPSVEAKPHSDKQDQGQDEQPPDEQQQEQGSGPNFISAARDAAASLMSLPFLQGSNEQDKADAPDDQSDGGGPPEEEKKKRQAERNRVASRERRLQTTDDDEKKQSQRETDDCGKMVYTARSSSVGSARHRSNDQNALPTRKTSTQDEGGKQAGKGENAHLDTDTELDVDAMLRKEIAWLKADGYLAGQASFFQSISEQTILVTFPTDDAHSAFITTVIEGVGIGSDFGSVVVLPVSGGMAAYRHQGWNNPEDRLKNTEEKSPNPEDSPTWLSCWAGMRKRAPFHGKGGDELDSDGKGSLKQDSDPGQLKNDKGEEGEEREKGRINDAEEAERQKARKDKYMNAASKLRVHQVIEQTQTNATLDFDYLAYLVISSVLAAVGLGTNSAPTIVASMLVAPLMGPIMAMSLAINLRRWRLAWLGAWNFGLSLFIAIGIGFVAGLCGLPFVTAQEDWPTFEMQSRSGARTLLVGLVIATFSGGGVALSILSDNSSSLVGVAISAALLPPAVNTGLSFAVAVAHETVHADWDAETARWVTLGAHSIALVLLNSVCVALSASIMFRVKQVRAKGRRVVFWREDLEAGRRDKRRQSTKPR